MPREIRDYDPALRLLLRNPSQNIMLVRSLQFGQRPGFSVIVDDASDVRAVLLVTRADWRGPRDNPVSLQLEAADRGAAISLLSWLPRGARYRIQTYRAELHEMLQPFMKADRTEKRFHSVATREGFRPSQLQEMVRELTPADGELWRAAEQMPGIAGAQRLFGLVRDGELQACSALAPAETEYVSVQGVFTQARARQLGLGAAVLSAATQAGLATGKSVTFSTGAEDIPSLRTLSGLGFGLACTEWELEGST